MSDCIRRERTVWTTCPCAPCRADQARKTKLHRNGRYNRIPSEAAWEVLDKLLALGWTSQAISNACGLPWRSIESAIHMENTTGRRRKFGPVTARMIVNHGEPTQGTVGATGSCRRLQGLARQGWSLEQLAIETGIGFSTLAAIRSGATGRVAATRHSTIREHAARLAMTPGTSAAATRMAANKGWAGLLAWDDIDDPADSPRGTDLSTHRDPDDVDPVIVDRLLRQEHMTSTPAEKREAMRLWLADGKSQASLCKAHGWAENRYTPREDDVA